MSLEKNKLHSEIKNKVARNKAWKSLYIRLQKLKFRFRDVNKRDYYSSIFTHRGYESISNPYQILEVHPETIVHSIPSWIKAEFNYNYCFDFRYLRHNHKKTRIVGMLLDGDWDRFKTPAISGAFYNAFYERLIMGKEWEETILFDKFMGKEGKSNKRMSKHSTFNSYKENYLLKWERLYNDIKYNGYISQAEANGKPEKEIEVCVSRSGKLLFRDGKHRLLFARFLKLETIPVIVNVWHQGFIKKIQQEYQSEKVTPEIALKWVGNSQGNGKS